MSKIQKSHKNCLIHLEKKANGNFSLKYQGDDSLVLIIFLVILPTFVLLKYFLKWNPIDYLGLLTILMVFMTNLVSELDLGLTKLFCQLFSVLIKIAVCWNFDYFL